MPDVHLRVDDCIDLVGIFRDHKGTHTSDLKVKIVNNVLLLVEKDARSKQLGLKSRANPSSKMFISYLLKHIELLKLVSMDFL